MTSPDILARWLAIVIAVAAVVAGFQDFGQQVTQQAVVVAWCESRLNSDAKSATNDFGLFQINRSVHRGVAPDQVWDFDLEANIFYARFLWEGRGWKPWACQPHPDQPWKARVMGYDPVADRWVCCKGTQTVPAEVRGLWWLMTRWW